MKDMFDQWTKTMENMWEPWRQMMKDAPSPSKADIPFADNWRSLIGAMRSTYEVNTSWWRTFMDHGEGLLFRMFKESPLYNEAMEERMRESMDTIKKANDKQLDLIKEQFDKIESMLKEREESS
ncbi:MAG: hypothetical protein RDU20_14435 [Desulfomonilaceae bacterium]|nr:hypothetical protein [Desulfomonilaceae bacterium]